MPIVFGYSLWGYNKDGGWVGAADVFQHRRRLSQSHIHGEDAIRVRGYEISAPLLERLIEIFTDKDDVIIDPCAGSGSTLLAALKTGRRAYGFEIKKDFYKKATEQVSRCYSPNLFCQIKQHNN